MRSLRAVYLSKKTPRYRLTHQVAKCPQLRANCANCKQTAPTTSHLGHLKATQFCRYKGLKELTISFNIAISAYKTLT